MSTVVKHSQGPFVLPVRDITHRPGEMRELETIRLALSCASMGLLVFGTLHTNNAPKTIDRVIDAFPAEEHSF